MGQIYFSGTSIITGECFSSCITYQTKPRELIQTFVQNPKSTFVYHKLQSQDLMIDYHCLLILPWPTKTSKKYTLYFSRLSTLLQHFDIPETLPLCWFIPWCRAFLERKVCEGQSLEECPVSWQFVQTVCLGLVWWVLLFDAVGPRALAEKHGKATKAYS